MIFVRILKAYRSNIKTRLSGSLSVPVLVLIRPVKTFNILMNRADQNAVHGATR